MQTVQNILEIVGTNFVEAIPSCLPISGLKKGEKFDTNEPKSFLESPEKTTSHFQVIQSVQSFQSFSHTFQSPAIQCNGKIFTNRFLATKFCDGVTD